MPGFSSPVGEHRYRDCRCLEMTVLNESRMGPALLASALTGAFAQPAEQRLPPEFLAMLIQLDRFKAGNGR